MKLLLVLFLGIAVAEETKVFSDKLKVSVYYETLCGDSRRFITTQLYPVKSSSLGQYFDIDLVPYGKATTTTQGNTFSFSCQHGNAECEGNKMHACALKYITSSNSSLDFIYCSMSSKNPPQSLSNCSKKVGLEESNISEISSCAQGSEGSQLLAANGERTHSLTPKLYFVPWITFDAKFTEDNLQNSQGDFKSVVCKELKRTKSFSCNGGHSIETKGLVLMVLVGVGRFF